MKFYFFLMALGLVFGSNAAFSQNLPSQEPSVKMPREMAIEVGGMEEANKTNFNCHLLLTKQWPYPNAQVTAFCNDAETACLRYALIRKYMKTAKGGALTRMKRDLTFAENDTQLRIRGCELAIEASAHNVDFISELGGKNAY